MSDLFIIGDNALDIWILHPPNCFLSKLTAFEVQRVFFNEEQDRQLSTQRAEESYLTVSSQYNCSANRSVVDSNHFT